MFVQALSRPPQQRGPHGRCTIILLHTVKLPNDPSPISEHAPRQPATDSEDLSGTQTMCLQAHQQG